MRTANISELKELIKAIGDTEALVCEFMEGLSFQEIIAVFHAFGDVACLIRDVNVVLPEFESLDDAGRAELVQYVSENCKFPASVSVEAWTKKILSAIIMASAVVRALEK